MKRYLLHIIYIIITSAGLFVVSACCHEEEERWDRPTKEMDRTLIFYMAGENSLARFVAADSSEIARGMAGLPEGCRVVMYIDDHKSSRICVGTREHPIEIMHQYERNIYSTDSTEMEGVLARIFKQYPAKSYGLVMWSHASGWVFWHTTAGRPRAKQARRRTFGIDNQIRSSSSNSGRQMNLTTLAHVLSHHPHLDFIFFDACYMQNIEVAYELRKVTDWVMGSPAEIPGDGAPYDDLLGLLASPEAQPNLALQAYYDYYVTGFGRMSYDGAILSAVKTSELPQLAEATKPLLRRILKDRTLIDCSDVQRYCPLDSSQYFTEFYDMGNVLYNYATEDEYQLWYKSLERAVPYRYLSPRWTSANPPYSLRVKDAEHCAAVSMFVPTTYYDNLWWADDNRNLYSWMDEYHQLEWYKAVGLDATGW